MTTIPVQHIEDENEARSARLACNRSGPSSSPGSSSCPARPGEAAARSGGCRLVGQAPPSAASRIGGRHHPRDGSPAHAGAGLSDSQPPDEVMAMDRILSLPEVKLAMERMDRW